MARQNGSIELLPVVPSLPVPGANTGGFFRFGGHVYFDTGTAVVQIDQQALLSTLTNTVPSTPSDGTTLGLFDFNAARPESAIVDFFGVSSISGAFYIGVFSVSRRFFSGHHFYNNVTTTRPYNDRCRNNNGSR